MHVRKSQTYMPPLEALLEGPCRQVAETVARFLIRQKLLITL